MVFHLELQDLFEPIATKTRIMGKVTIRFPNLYLLWSFTRTLNYSDFEIIADNNTLICVCSSGNVKDALINFKGCLITSNSGVLNTNLKEALL